VETRVVSRAGDARTVHKKALFESVLNILPRTKLDALATTYLPTVRPNHMNRRDLIDRLILMESYYNRHEIRYEVAEYVHDELIKTPKGKP
jgi:hypothetical protein